MCSKARYLSKTFNGWEKKRKFVVIVIKVYQKVIFTWNIEMENVWRKWSQLSYLLPKTKALTATGLLDHLQMTKLIYNKHLRIILKPYTLQLKKVITESDFLCRSVSTALFPADRESTLPIWFGNLPIERSTPKSGDWKRLYFPGLGGPDWGILNQSQNTTLFFDSKKIDKMCLSLILLN